MKRIPVSLAILMLFAVLSVGQKYPTKTSKQPAKHEDAVVRIKGHVMGETVAEFIAIDPASKDQLDTCNPHECRIEGMASDVNPTTWTFKDRVLISLTMTIQGNSYPNVREDLTRKFGFKPMETVLQQKNAYGAKWNRTSADWSYNRKVSGMLQSDQNPSNPTLILVLSLNSAVETSRQPIR
jgi:hypothetical protein